LQNIRHIVALSGGKDSVAMALRLAETEPENDYEYVYTPTGNELPEMKQHILKLETILGKPIRDLAPQTLVQIIEKNQTLPNFWMRFCTRQIKIVPFEKFIREIGSCVVYVGIRADETEGDREGVDWERIEGVTRRFPMDEWGWNLGDVLNYLECRGIEIPYRTDCAWCFFQKIYEWYSLWLNNIDLWMEGEGIEEKYGHTFRTPGRDTWPVSMKGLRLAFESGRIPKERITKRTTMCAVCAR
jgi:3'-phosphoadenosine 5'-phosphosulfate sulfotransferase (PAPS reductase)/FAD synthetase